MHNFFEKYFIPYRGTLGRWDFLKSIILNILIILPTIAVFYIIIWLEIFENSIFFQGNNTPSLEKFSANFTINTLLSFCLIGSLFYATFIFPFFYWEKRVAQIIGDRVYSTAIVFIVYILPILLSLLIYISTGNETVSPMQNIIISVLNAFSFILFLASIFIKGSKNNIDK